MKTAVAAFVLLGALILSSVFLSSAQRNVLYPISEAICNFPSDVNELKTNADTVIKVLVKSKKELEKNGFTICLGVPQEEYERLHSIMEKTIIYLREKEYPHALAYLEECKIYLDTLIDYCSVSANNIL